MSAARLAKTIQSHQNIRNIACSLAWADFDCANLLNGSSFKLSGAQIPFDRLFIMSGEYRE